jgi:hypothetical protein
MTTDAQTDPTGSSTSARVPGPLSERLASSLEARSATPPSVRTVVSARMPIARHVPMPTSPWFPSGHAASGYAFAAAVGRRCPRWHGPCGCSPGWSATHESTQACTTPEMSSSDRSSAPRSEDRLGTGPLRRARSPAHVRTSSTRSYGADLHNSTPSPDGLGDGAPTTAARRHRRDARAAGRRRARLMLVDANVLLYAPNADVRWINPLA